MYMRKLNLIIFVLIAPAIIVGCGGKNMKEQKDAVTMKGKGFTLVGDEVNIGDKAPDAALIANDMSKVKLSSFAGKVCIICSVPSLDTSVCSTMTRKFNEKASQLGDNAVVLTISMDLPFAQKRWCGAEGIERVKTLSDYREAEFGTKYGLLIKELRLLARAVFVVDKSGVIKYKQLVKEISNEPDYDAALEAAKKLL
jgi:thioredoxin-dependent peroxiredoxin